jgi:hypothetical protein
MAPLFQNQTISVTKWCSFYKFILVHHPKIYIDSKIKITTHMRAKIYLNIADLYFISHIATFKGEF